jgi:CRISPR system Cascade subunit CasD
MTAKPINKETQMPRFLILKLDGVMQGWGGHTYEDWRPTELFPTRSGLLGLLGACLGIDRQDIERLNALASSVQFTIRAENRKDPDGKFLDSLRLCDYHTIEHARKVDGKPNENPVQSYRWYLFDAPFTVAVEEISDAPVALNVIAEKIRKPIFTPFLGRRSCPLSRPLLDREDSPLGKPFEAKSALEALEKSGMDGSVIYTESSELSTDQKLRMRDVPIYGRIRRFATREVFIHSGMEAQNVSL